LKTDKDGAEVISLGKEFRMAVTCGKKKCWCEH